MSNKSIETIFQIVAVIFFGVAAYFLWRGNYEMLFVFSVVSSVCYFLNYRFQIKERLRIREEERLEKELNEANYNRQILQENTEFIVAEKQESEKQKETFSKK